jgi:hypothetical protein
MLTMARRSILVMHLSMSIAASFLISDCSRRGKDQVVAEGSTRLDAETIPFESAPIRPAPTTFPELNAIHGLTQQTVRVTYRGVPLASPIAPTRSKAEAQRRAEEAFSKLRQGATFDSLQEAYDDGRSTEVSVDAFNLLRTESAVTITLGVNQVSDIIDSQYGFLIIKRLPNRPADASP